MTLYQTSFDWEFIPIAGQTFSDTGSANCVTFGSTPAPTPTATPVPASTSTPAPTATEGPMMADLNLDGNVDVLDVQLSVNVFLGTETDPGIVSRSDINADGSIDVLDVQIVIN